MIDYSSIAFDRLDPTSQALTAIAWEHIDDKDFREGVKHLAKEDGELREEIEFISPFFLVRAESGEVEVDTTEWYLNFSKSSREEIDDIDVDLLMDLRDEFEAKVKGILNATN